MSKLIYKSERPYSEDINDLIEKGGVGSGVKGHTTPKQEQDQAKNHLKEATGTLVDITPDGNKMFSTVKGSAFSEKTILGRLSSKFKETFDVKVTSSTVKGQKVLNVVCTRKSTGA